MKTIKYMVIKIYEKVYDDVCLSPITYENILSFQNWMPKESLL